MESHQRKKQRVCEQKRNVYIKTAGFSAYVFHKFLIEYLAYKKVAPFSVFRYIFITYHSHFNGAQKRFLHTYIKNPALYYNGKFVASFCKFVYQNVPLFQSDISNDVEFNNYATDCIMNSHFKNVFNFPTNAGPLRLPADASPLRLPADAGPLRLPTELFGLLFDYLEIIDLMMFSATCQNAMHMVHDASMWQNRYHMSSDDVSTFLQIQSVPQKSMDVLMLYMPNLISFAYDTAYFITLPPKIQRMSVPHTQLHNVVHLPLTHLEIYSPDDNDDNDDILTLRYFLKNGNLSNMLEFTCLIGSTRQDNITLEFPNMPELKHFAIQSEDDNIVHITFPDTYVNTNLTCLDTEYHILNMTKHFPNVEHVSMFTYPTEFKMPPQLKTLECDTNVALSNVHHISTLKIASHCVTRHPFRRQCKCGMLLPTECIYFMFCEPTMIKKIVTLCGSTRLNIILDNCVSYKRQLSKLITLFAKAHNVIVIGKVKYLRSNVSYHYCT